MKKVTHVRVAGVAALVVGASVAGFAGAGSARADASYDAFAKATGIQAQITNQSIPLGLVIEGIGPEADAHQTSLQTSDANAHFPYFGDTVPTLPETGAAVVGLPSPRYPLIASSSYGGRPAVTSYPGVTLRAESSESRTYGSSLVGSDATGLNTEALVESARSGDVTSTAVFAAKTIGLGTFATLSGVTSSAEVRASGDTGDISRVTELSIGRITADGLSIRVPNTTPGTVPVPVPVPGFPNPEPAQFPPIPFPMGGQTIDSPDIGFSNGSFFIRLPFAGETQQYAVPTASVLEAFKAAGVTITYQDRQETKTGVIAPVMSFSFEVPSPPPNTYYSGPTAFTYTTGQTVAAVDLRPVPDSAGEGLAPVAGGGAGAGAIAPDAAAGSELGAADSVDLAASAVGALPSTVAGGAPAGYSTGARDVTRDGIVLASEASVAGVDAGSFYRVLIFLTLAGIAVGTVIRLFGVRSL